MGLTTVKKIAGLMVLAVGAVFVAYAIHVMQKTHEAKQNVSAVAHPSLDEPLGTIVGNVLTKKVSENDRKQTYLLIGGMAVLLSGGGLVFLFRSKS